MPHSHAKPPPHFASLGRLSFGKDVAQSPYPGWQSPQRRKQSERYAKCHFESIDKKYKIIYYRFNEV
jgi:hypothetical protein